jgi:predicted Rossmann fold flavoprotein
MQKQKKEVFDIVVVGGGPAGLFAAISAAENSKKKLKILIIEKNKELGKKLKITGGGRCNITNAEYDNRKFLSFLKEADKFLFSTFAIFSVKDTFTFFERRGLPLKIEKENRAFPITEKAEDVFDLLEKEVHKNKINVILNTTIKKINKTDNVIESLDLSNGISVFASKFILATGGLSHPETGSTGDGFVFLKELGHTIKPQASSLVPIKTDDEHLKKLSGVSFTNLSFSVYSNNKKVLKKNGKVLITHVGLSGPAILNASSFIRETLKKGEVYISLDFLDEVALEHIDKYLLDLLSFEKNKKIKNIKIESLAAKTLEIILEKSKIDGEKFCNSLSKEERKRLGENLKNYKVKVTGLLSASKAIVSSGGVSLTEVDFKKMKSKLYDNLYIVGDLLDIDRPSGGYSLQICWSTGWVAGLDASRV